MASGASLHSTGTHSHSDLQLTLHRHEENFGDSTAAVHIYFQVGAN